MLEKRNRKTHWDCKMQNRAVAGNTQQNSLHLWKELILQMVDLILEPARSDN